MFFQQVVIACRLFGRLYCRLKFVINKLIIYLCLHNITRAFDDLPHA